MTGNTAEIPAHVRANLAGLYQLREKRRFSLKDLQVLSGVRADIIKAWENGTGTPTKSKYNKLSPIFNWRDWE